MKLRSTTVTIIFVVISIFFILYSQLQRGSISELKTENSSLLDMGNDLIEDMILLQERDFETSARLRMAEIEIEKIKEELEHCESEN
jgi:hypothetical protein